MQIPVAIYIASFLGSLALLLLMPKRGLNLRVIGTLVGASSLGGLWLFLSCKMNWGELGIGNGAFAFYYVFSAISIASAVKVITHTRPLYSALWFVMVILASSGLFLVLGAGFIALAVVLIYGGAILVTYMFVLMLASQTGAPASDKEIDPANRYAYEPVLAVAAGFLLLSVLLTLAFEPMAPNLAAKGPSDAQIIATTLSDRNPSMDAATSLHNIERVGLDLFQSHPLGLELAGIVLLVALIGAVVIAKTVVPNEDQTHA